MATTNEPVILEPQLTREGLRRLFSLKTEGGLAEAITHVGLTSTAFEPTAEMTTLPGEIDRWPILDGEEIEGETVQFNLYLEYPYDGTDKAIRGYGIYLSDGTLVATYSDEQVEAYISKQFMLDSFIHLILSGAPADTLTVVNTGVRFNPGVREALLMLMEQSLDKTLRMHDMNEAGRVQDDKIAATEQNNIELQEQLDETRNDITQLATATQQREAANFDLLAGNQLLMQERILDLRLQEVA